MKKPVRTIKYYESYRSFGEGYAVETESGGLDTFYSMENDKVSYKLLTHICQLKEYGYTVRLLGVKLF